MLSSLFLTCFCCHLHQKSQTSPTEASFPNLTCSVIWNVPVRLSCWRSKLIFYLFCLVQGSRLNFCNQWLSKCYLVENNTVISLLIGTSRPNPLKYRHRRGYSSVISLHWTLLGALLTLLVTGNLCQSQNIAYHRELTVRRNNIMKLYLSLLESHPASSLSFTCTILAYSRMTA